MVDDRRVFVRNGNFVQFEQYGVKLEFPDDVTDVEYYRWLDQMIAAIADLVPGAEIVEKPAARTDPRRNFGVYYDTSDYRLLYGHMALRTTSNPKTHAFCAFKYGEDEHGIRRDNRHIFEGADKLSIQLDPTGEQATAAVQRLLARHDIMHPGIVLEEATGIRPQELTPALSLIQYRRTFYVWLNKADVLRCSLDRAEVTDLRTTAAAPTRSHFSEVEVPIYPRISAALRADERVQRLIDAISASIVDRFGASEVHDSKYRRGARVIRLLD